MDARVGVVVAVVLALLGAAPVAPARAEPAAALAQAPPGALLLFDTASPGVVTLREITGLGANEGVVGIDLRPATSQLYVVTVTTGSVANSVVRTYTLDPASGAATLVGATAAALAGAADLPSGVDFSPAADRIRFTNTNDENARINPMNGALAGNDTDLTPASVAVVAAAYDQNTAGAAATTLYVIDRTASGLGRQGGIGGTPSANGGAVTAVGALGITLDPTSDGGFDIAASGTAYAILTDNADDRPRLYTVNLGTGALTNVGLFPLPVRSLTILPPPAPPPPPPPPPTDDVAPTGLFDPGDRQRVRTVQGAGLAVQFSCDEACTAVASLTAKKTVVARGQGMLAAAGVGQLTLSAVPEGGKVLRRARRAKHLKTLLTVTFTDTAGNTSTRERPLDLRR